MAQGAHRALGRKKTAASCSLLTALPGLSILAASSDFHLLTSSRGCSECRPPPCPSLSVSHSSPLQSLALRFQTPGREGEREIWLTWAVLWSEVTGFWPGWGVPGHAPTQLAVRVGPCPQSHTVKTCQLPLSSGCGCEILLMRDSGGVRLRWAF